MSTPENSVNLDLQQEGLVMRRRDFLTVSAIGAVGATVLEGRRLRAEPANLPRDGIIWQRNGQTGLFQQVVANGQPLVRGKQVGLLDGFCRSSGGGASGKEATVAAARATGQCGTVRLSLTHRLLASDGSSKEDLLEAGLTLHNSSDGPQTVEVGFQSTARPCERATDQQVYLPVSAGFVIAERFAELGSQQWLQDCRQAVGAEGFLCHYLEPVASDPRQATTRASCWRQ